MLLYPSANSSKKNKKKNKKKPALPTDLVTSIFELTNPWT